LELTRSSYVRDFGSSNFLYSKLHFKKITNQPSQTTRLSNYITTTMHLRSGLVRSIQTKSIRSKSNDFQKSSIIPNQTKLTTTQSSSSSSSIIQKRFFSIEISNQRSLLFSNSLFSKNNSFITHNINNNNKNETKLNSISKEIIFKQQKRNFIDEQQRKQLKTPQFKERETLFGHLSEKNSIDWKTASFYRFCDLSSLNLNTIKSELMKKWHQINITGRIYISPEGINGYISIPPGD